MRQFDYYIFIDFSEIVKESQIKHDSVEYKLSLIIDNLLNIERRKSNV